MSALLRLSRTLRILRTPKTNKTMSSHFFSPSHTPSHLGLPRARFYSNGGYSGYGLQRTNNLAVLYTLMGTNIAIFGYAIQGYQAPLITFMQKMTMNLTEVLHGNYLQVVTCVFTHLDIGHIFSNMFTVYFLGRFLAFAPQITPLRYVTIALGSGISGSIGYLFNRSYQLTSSGQTRDYNRCIGFSGAVMGISSVAACLYPTAKVAIWGIVPMPLWALVTGYAVYDGYYLSSTDSRIGHAGHLGGLAFGLVYYVARLRGLRV